MVRNDQMPRQRPTVHILAKIRAVNRMECVKETMRFALNSLATLFPNWLAQQPLPLQDWLTRYGHRVEDYRLPTSAEKRIAYALQTGQDGYQLMQAIDQTAEPTLFWQLPAVDALRSVWLQQYQLSDNQLQWRTQQQGLPPAKRFISSPCDRQAHYARKNTFSWVGYKVHLTETCELDQPHLITQVVTTAGPVPDGIATPLIHQGLANKALLPSTHLVDAGYVDAEVLVTSCQQYGVDLLGPTRSNNHWQARAKTGYAAADFKLDWTIRQAVCPQGKISKS